MPALSSGELALLRHKTQRYRLYFVKWDTWQIRQNTPRLALVQEDGTTKLNFLGYKTIADFEPVVNIGSNRMAFVGEAISFDSSRSFAVHESVILPTPAWTFESGSPATYNGTSVNVSWSTPGLYEITCTIGSTTAQRYVRVFADRTQITYDVVNVSGISGNISGGWKANVTIAPSDDSPGVSSQSISFGNFQAAGLFIEEEWVDSDGTVTQQPISTWQHDPRLLLSGYIQQDSVKIDANTHNVSFTLGSLADQMNLGMVHDTQTYSQAYIDSDNAGPDKIPDPPLGPQGIILDMAPYDFTMSDHILYWMQHYTNVLDRHDFITWYDSTLQVLDTVATRESSLWSSWSSLVDNEFARLFVDPGGQLHFEPNPSIRSTGWFEGEYPVVMHFTDEDLLNIQVNERKMRNVIYVQLNATRVYDGAPFEAKYPLTGPPSGAGSWLLKSGLTGSRQSFYEHIVQNVYNDANRKITATLTTGLNRAIRVPDRIQITLDDPNRNIAWVGKEFYVESVSYSLNPGAGTFTSTIQIVEVV